MLYLCAIAASAAPAGYPEFIRATKKAPRGRLSVASGQVSAVGGGSPHVARSAGVSAGHLVIPAAAGCRSATHSNRSEEHTSELQSLMRISYAVFCLKKKKMYKRYHEYYNKYS